MILSNSQSAATLWVLDTCLIVGLLPLMIILITASLSSKCRASHRIEKTSQSTKHNQHYAIQERGAGLESWLGFGCACLMGCHATSFPVLCLWVFFNCLREVWNTSTTKTQRSRAGNPSMRKPASREIISASVQLCETEVCFLHIQLNGTNVCLPKMHKSHPDVDFESSRSPANSESWNNPHLLCCAVFPTWQCCLNSHVWWMYAIKRDKRMSQALVHFVIAQASLLTNHRISGLLPMRAKYRHFRLVHCVKARGSLFTDHEMSGLLPIRAKYSHFRTNCEQTFVIFTTDPNSSS